MKFTLTIDNYDNAAMVETPLLATMEALDRVIKQINNGRAAGFIMDDNGNKVGHWEFVD